MSFNSARFERRRSSRSRALATCDCTCSIWSLNSEMCRQLRSRYSARRLLLFQLARLPVSERLLTRPRHLFRHVAGVTPSLDRYDYTVVLQRQHCVAVARGPTHLRPSADTLRLLKGERFDCAFRVPLPWLVVRKPIRDKAGHSRPLPQAITQPERALGLRLKVRPKVKGASAL